MRQIQEMSGEGEGHDMQRVPARCEPEMLGKLMKTRKFIHLEDCKMQLKTPEKASK